MPGRSEDCWVLRSLERAVLVEDGGIVNAGAALGQWARTRCRDGHTPRRRVHAAAVDLDRGRRATGDLIGNHCIDLARGHVGEGRGDTIEEHTVAEQGAVYRAVGADV